MLTLETLLPQQVMEVLMSLQGSQMETDDPTTSYMLQVWVHFLIPQNRIYLNTVITSFLISL